MTTNELYTMHDVANDLGWPLNKLYKRTYYAIKYRLPEGSLRLGQRIIYTAADVAEIKKLAAIHYK